MQDVINMTKFLPHTFYHSTCFSTLSTSQFLWCTLYNYHLIKCNKQYICMISSLERGQAQDCNLYLHFVFEITCTHTIEWLCCAYNKIYHMLWIHDMLLCSALPHLSAYFNTEVQCSVGCPGY